MTDMDMSQYLGAFLDEADDNLQRLDDLLLNYQIGRASCRERV